MTKQKRNICDIHLVNLKANGHTVIPIFNFFCNINTLMNLFKQINSLMFCNNVYWGPLFVLVTLHFIAHSEFSKIILTKFINDTLQKNLKIGT